MIQTLSALLLSIAFAGAQSVPTVKAPPSADSEKKDVERMEDSAFDSELPRLIQCQLECVEVSHEDMTNLLFLRDQSFAEATQLRKQLQEMIAVKKAKVVDTMVLVAKSGQAAQSQSLLEYIRIGGYGAPSFGGHEPRTSPADGTTQSSMREMPIPSYFDTREVGGSLEVEPTLGNDNKTIDIRFSWNVVDHEGEKAWLDYKDLRNNAYKIEMSKFFVKRVSTSFTCVPSSYTLVATVDPQNEKGRRDTSRKWLIFAKCEVQYIR